MTDDVQLGSGKTCFIISPIGDKYGAVGTPERSRYEESLAMWDEVLEPACVAFGVTPVRADKISDTGEIPDQIFTYLRDSEIVIADLSHANPNVMYELGLRHSVPGKITIQIGEQGFLPFDVTTIRTIKFRRSESGRISARNDLMDALRTALNGGGTPLRATSVFTAGATLSDAERSSDAEKSAEADDVVEEDVPGLVEVLAEGEAGMSHISAVLNESSEQIQAVNTQFTLASGKMTSAEASGNGAFSSKLLVVRELAGAIAAPADSLQALSDEFFADVERVDAMLQYVISRLEAEEEDPAGYEGFIESSLKLVDAASEASVGIMSFRDGSRGLPKLSKLLAPASRTLVLAANRYLEGISLMESWRTPLKALHVQM